jgi:hypothetical protein
MTPGKFPKSQPERLAIQSSDRHRSLGGCNIAVNAARGPRQKQITPANSPRASRNVWRSNPRTATGPSVAATSQSMQPETKADNPRQIPQEPAGTSGGPILGPPPVPRWPQRRSQCGPRPKQITPGKFPKSQPERLAVQSSDRHRSLGGCNVAANAARDKSR